MCAPQCFSGYSEWLANELNYYRSYYGTVHRKHYDDSIYRLTLFSDHPRFIREYFRLTRGSNTYVCHSIKWLRSNIHDLRLTMSRSIQESSALDWLYSWRHCTLQCSQSWPAGWLLSRRLLSFVLQWWPGCWTLAWSGVHFLEDEKGLCASCISWS